MIATLLLVSVLAAEPLGPGDHTRNLSVGDLERNCIVHIPPQYDPDKPPR